MITFIAVFVVLASISIAVWPLLRRNKRNGGPRFAEDTNLSEMLAQKDTTLLAISELQSDYEMGSLSKADYEELRKKYEERAVNIIKTTDELLGERGLDATNELDREIEDRVSKLRGRKERPTGEAGTVCLTCGSDVFPGDAFCSRCGVPVSPKCPHCSKIISQGDRFCPGCGSALASGVKK